MWIEQTREQRADRLAEIAKIFAAGLIRLSARKSSAKPGALGESSLDFSPDQSGRPSLTKRENLDA